MTEQNPSIYINGDGNVIGDGNVVTITKQYFTGEYERLQDAYIDPSQVFDRVDLDHFVGREWLLAEVDAFLCDHDRGYFILEAEAGLGKTTFMAWLARARGYIQHFCELAPGLEGVGAGLKSLAAQLVLTCHLSIWEAQGVLPGAATRPDYFHNLLKQAAAQRHPGEKVVLVIDALDEAGTPPTQNVLGLPRVLPVGVYVIVSQRPVPVTLQVEDAPTHRRVFPLTATSNENRADMRHFLDAATTWPGVARALQQTEHTSEQFVTALLEKCRGLWIYLHYIIHEIEQGERWLDLETLPDGMMQYYSRYWARWRDADDQAWYATYLPLLATLAAAQEAVALPRLCALAAVPEHAGLERLLGERWRPFLAIDRAGDAVCYRLYHASLREFLDGRHDRSGLAEGEQQFTEELACATRQAHIRIASRYLATWGGMDAGLPGLQDAQVRNLDDGYGLRHLAAHLVGAGQEEDLHRLLRLERVQDEEIPDVRLGIEGWWDRLRHQRRTWTLRHYGSCWYEAHESAGTVDAYLTDVTRAWQLVEGRTSCEQSPRVAPAAPGSSYALSPIGLQCRYALVMASINSLSSTFPPKVLAALVEKGVWPAAQGLAYARHIPKPEQQAAALVELARHLPGPLLDEAVAVAQGIGDAQARATALVGLAPYLAEPKVGAVLREALVAAEAVRDEDVRAKTLAMLTPRLPETLLCEALTVVRAIKDAWPRARALADLTPRLAEPERGAVLQEALLTAREIEYIVHRVWAFAAIVHGLPIPERTGVIQETLAAMQGYHRWSGGSPDDPYGAMARAAALIPLVLDLPDEEQRTSAMLEIEGCAWRLWQKEEFAEALVTLLARLPSSLERQVQWALHMTESPGLMARLVSHVPGVDLWQTRWAPRRADDARLRLDVLARLAPLLPEPLLREALAVAKAMPHDLHARTLIVLAPYLPEPLLREALVTAKALPMPFRGEAVIALSPRPLELFLRKGRSRWEFQRIGDHAAEMAAFGGLAPHLAKSGNLDTAWRSARMMASTCPAAGLPALAGLLPYLPESQRSAALQEVIREGDGLSGARLPHLDRTRLAMLLRQATRPEEMLSTIGLEIVIPYLLEPERSAALREALMLARASHFDDVRASTVMQLALHLTGPLWTEALSVVQAIKDDGTQVRLASDLAHRYTWYASQLPESERKLTFLRNALMAVQVIGSEKTQAQALADLAPHLPQTMLQEVLSAPATWGAWAQAKALTEMASRSAGSERDVALRNALAAELTIRDEEDRAEALTELAPHLPEPERATAAREALMAATAIMSHQRRARALTDLAPHLSGPDRDVALKEALSTAQAIHSEPGRAETFARLVPYLAGPQRGAVLKKALKLMQVRHLYGEQVEVLAGLAPFVTESKRDVIIAKVRSFAPAPWERRQVAAGLITMAPHLAKTERDAALDEALVMVQTSPGIEERAGAVLDLAPRLPASLCQKLLMTETENRSYMLPRGFLAKLASALGATVLQLPELEREAILRQVMATIHTNDSEITQANVLIGLASFLPEPLLQEALAIAQAFKDYSARDEALAGLVQALVGLASRLLEPGRSTILHEALTVLERINYPGTQAQTLRGLAPNLPESLLRGFFAEGTRWDEWTQAEALLGLIMHLTGAERLMALQQALAAASAIRNEESRVDALLRLVPLLAGPERDAALRQAVAAAMAIGQTEAQHQAVTVLAPYLQDSLAGEAVVAAQAIQDQQHRDRTLGELVLHLRESHAEKALAAAQAIQDERDRGEALAGLASHLAKYPPTELHRIWRGILHSLAVHTRADLLFDLAALEPVITALGGPDAGGETVRAIQDVGHWWP